MKMIALGLVAMLSFTGCADNVVKMAAIQAGMFFTNRAIGI